MLEFGFAVPIELFCSAALYPVTHESYCNISTREGKKRREGNNIAATLKKKRNNRKSVLNIDPFLAA